MRTSLGEFEHLVLLAILRLGDGAYGAAIIDEIERRTGRDVSNAAAYVTLTRLGDKGLVLSRTGRGDEKRGGRRKRFYRVTDAGLERLKTSADALFDMWEGLESVRESAG